MKMLNITTMIPKSTKEVEEIMSCIENFNGVYIRLSKLP